MTLPSPAGGVRSIPRRTGFGRTAAFASLLLLVPFGGAGSHQARAAEASGIGPGRQLEAARDLHVARIRAEDAWSRLAAGDLSWKPASVEAARAILGAADRWEAETDRLGPALLAPDVPPAAADRNGSTLTAHRARRRRIARLLPALDGPRPAETARALLAVLDEATPHAATDSRSNVQVRHVRRIAPRDARAAFRDLDGVRLPAGPTAGDGAAPSPAVAAAAARIPPDAGPDAVAASVRAGTRALAFHAEAVGAEGCLRDRHCSAFDAAQLLAGLLRARRVPARLAYGTVEADGAAVAAGLLGPGATLQEGLDSLHLGGVPAVRTATGRIRFEHVWVRARVGETWHDLDPVFDRSARAAPAAASRATVPVDPIALLSRYLAEPTDRTPIGADMLPRRSTPRLPGGSRPVAPAWVTVVHAADLAGVPPAYRGMVALSAGGSEARPLLDLRLPLADVMATGILFHPAPASALDRRIAGIAGGAAAVPPHLVTTTTLVRCGNGEVGALPPLPWGTALPITVTLLPPNGDPVDVHGVLQTGAPAALTVVPFEPGPGWLPARWRDADAPGGDAVAVARLFAATGSQFFADLLDETSRLAVRAGGRPFLSPSAVLVAGALHAPSGLARPPLFAEPAGITVDVGRFDQQLLPTPGASPVAFEAASGAALSAWEARALEIATGLDAVSTVVAMKASSASGGGLRVLRGAATDDELSRLSPAARIDVRRALASGLVVLLPRLPQTDGGWIGESYVALDPRSGRGAYLIRGGLRGALTTDRVAPLHEALRTGADATPLLRAFRKNRAGRALLAREGWTLGPVSPASARGPAPAPRMEELLAAFAAREGSPAPTAGPWPPARGADRLPNPGAPIAVHRQGTLLWIGQGSRVLERAAAERLRQGASGYDPQTRMWIGPAGLGVAAVDGQWRLIPLPSPF